MEIVTTKTSGMAMVGLPSDKEMTGIVWRMAMNKKQTKMSNKFTVCHFGELLNKIEWYKREIIILSSFNLIIVDGLIWNIRKDSPI